MKDGVAGIYKDGSYAAKNPGFGDDNAAWKAGNAYKMLSQTETTPTTVMEVGCGGGGILVELSKLLPNQTTFAGYEPMPEAFAICQKRQTNRIQFFDRVIDGYPDKVYDVVLCFDVFEHIEDPWTFLRNLKHWGKRFIFHIPLDLSAQMVLRDEPLMRVREQVGHIHYYSKSVALALLQECGYSIVDFFYTRAWETGYSTPSFRLAKIPRKILYALAPDFTVRLLGGFPLMVCAE